MEGTRRGGNRLVVAGALLSASLGACVSPLADDAEITAPTTAGAAASTAATTTTPTVPLASTTTAVVRVAAPSSTAVAGLLTFRGNATRTYYGQGPVPSDPQVLRRFPDRPDEPMCMESVDQGGPSRWCGTGWTGQPAVFERQGTTWLVFGAYDGAVHFLDADTGRKLLPDFPTGDLIKGSVTVDPDGYPLVYVGSRDNYLRVLAIDRPVPTELWKLSAYAVAPTLWNDDWDGSPLVQDDFLFEGGENSRLHIVRLNRAYRADGRVTVDPELVFDAPGWDRELLDDLGDVEVSIEGSVALHGTTLYFANSGGLVQGWDIAGLKDGVAPTRTFRFWTGDDTDATVVVDAEGMLYVASEFQRNNSRSRQVGQIIKLDPRRERPLVWSIADHPVGPSEEVAGVWATPALYRDLLIVPTNGGRLLGVDRRTGVVRWSKQLPAPVWQSPVVVDGVLLQGDCHGLLHAYDLADTAVEPPELWSLALGGCIESTPAVWKGRIYVGTRAGFLVTAGDRG